MKHLHIIERRDAKARGMVRYFTARPCKYGHFSERRTSVGHCVECLLLLQNTEKWVTHRKEKYQTDRERVLAKCKEWRLNNSERKSETAKAAYQANPEPAKTRAYQWKLDNPGRSKELNRARYLRDPKEHRRKQKTWAQANADRVNAMCAARRARKLKAGMVGHRALTDFVYAEASSLAKARSELFGFSWQVDHLVPLLGRRVCGLHIWYNFEVIPAVANARKGSNRIHSGPLQWLDLI